jgi:hypothetical protein
MYPDRKLRLLFALVFAGATLLRLGLAFVNREAFDDHVGVVELILQKDRLPEMEDCPECFQPKLFYFLTAIAVQIARIDPHHQSSIALMMQALNFGAGEVILALSLLLIVQLRPSEPRAGLLAFAMVALNPALIAANGMPSNDTFTILFSSLAIYLCWRFLQEGRWGYLAVSAIFAAMAVATKTNAWCTALAISLTLLLKSAHERRLSGAALAVAFLGCITVLTLFNPLSQYWENIQTHGTPVTLNVAREPFPSLFEKTYVRRPGIVSIQDGFLTFKLIDLLEYPRLTLGAAGYPAHRTSLWTDLYASANSVHFYNSPDSWHTKPYFEVSRSIYVLALVPAALFLLGFGRGLLHLSGVSVVRQGQSPANGDSGLFEIGLLAYLAFIIALALTYRDFSTMKAVYIYPAILSIVVLFLEGTDVFYGFLSKYNRWITGLFEALFVFLVVMYMIDVAHMIAHLYALNVG